MSDRLNAQQDSPRIDFYILSERHNRLTFLGKLIDQLYRDGQKVHIHTDDETLATQVDKALWTASDTSFVPHELYGNGEGPIMIGVNDPASHQNIMVNLANDVPAEFKTFARVVEIVDPQETLKVIGREHYKFYQKQDFEIHNHTIN